MWLNCERESAFLALFGKLLSAFFGLDENVVGMVEMFFVFIAGFPVVAPIVEFELVQGFEKLLIKSGLQFKSKTRE